MKNKLSSETNRNSLLWFAIILAAVLSLLFLRSFLPEYVHFSNDGPLGEQNCEWGKLPTGFTGIWMDLNDLGHNQGAEPTSIFSLVFMVLGPLGYSKFFVPVGLFILGMGAWTFFRSLRLSPLAAALGALAMTLNATFFADACWGLASHPMAFGMDFFALALIMSNTNETPRLTRWMRLALAGLCVGDNVTEAADIGALFSLLIAAFVVFKTFTEENSTIFKKIVRSVGRVFVVAIFAGFIAFQTILSLVGTSIVGVVGTAQDSETKAQHWDFATQWSLPKKETLGIIVPGVFGYRMDTPKDMTPALQDEYRGGV